MFVPTELTYVEVVVGMVGLFIAAYFAKKKQANKKYQQSLRDQGKLPPKDV